MRFAGYRTYAALGLLIAIAACSASGGVEAPEQVPDAGESSGDAAAAEIDAGPPEDAGFKDVDLDAERPLACGDAGFCETRLPTSDLGLPLSLRSVWVVDSNDVWSVTVEGLVLHYDGTSWTTAYKANHALYAVWATPTSVWVGGEAGLLFRRSAEGEWSRVESGHVAPIRAIYGTDDSDVWFTSHGGSVDHFDGTTLTHHRIDIPDLEVTTVFGRPGFGTYAAGHVKGILTREQAGNSQKAVPDRPYIFELSTENISVFGTSLENTRGLVPMAVVVTDSPTDAKRLFMVGYEYSKRWTTSGEFSYSRVLFSAFGPTGPVSLVNLVGYVAVANDRKGPIVADVPLLANAWDDIWLLRKMGESLRWDGTATSKLSFAMGYDHAPTTIFAAHGNATDAWIVGDGFAVRRATP